MKRKIWIAIAVFGIVCGSMTAPADAGDEKASGTVTYGPAEVDNTQLPGGGMIQRSHIKGIILADDPSTSIHLSSQDCFGTTRIGSDGSVNGHGYCDGVDDDGDHWSIWWHNTPQGNKWGFIDGTGKFEGIKGGGTTKPLAQKPDGRTAITWEGSWTMK